jgi:uncharacterized protein YndB with AHSA1/START domain
MSAVIVSLRIAAPPQTVFDAFTQDIALWWRPSQLFQITPRGDGALSFENQERLISTLPNGKTFEIGRITAWAPPGRLAFTWRQATFAPEQQTHVEVRFEPIGDETRVTVEHRGWDTIPRDHVARHGFPLAATHMRLGEHWRALLAGLAQSIG